MHLKVLYFSVYMSDKPDISTLYLRKFLSQSPLLSSRTPQGPMRSNYQHAKAITTRLATPQTSRFKYVRITQAQVLPSRNTTQLTSRNTMNCINCSERTNKIRISQSVQIAPNNNKHLRQIMRVSGQEMSELQLSAGGQNKLRSLLQAFFERRNKNKQQTRHQKRDHEFIPLHQMKASQSPKQRLFRRIDRQKRERQRLVESAILDKQLQPWQIQDTDFGV